MSKKIAALILAAGEGGRIGMPKWQLKSEGKTFLEIICGKLVLAQITDAVCVKRKKFNIENSALKYVVNPVPEYGMISSVYHGIKACPGYEAYLIWPVDHPFVSAATVDKLNSALSSVDPSIAVIRPSYLGKTGHPIILTKLASEKLSSPTFEGGLRNFIRQHELKCIDIAVEDENILKNINTTADLTDIEKLY